MVCCWKNDYFFFQTVASFLLVVGRFELLHRYLLPTNIEFSSSWGPSVNFEHLGVCLCLCLLICVCVCVCVSVCMSLHPCTSVHASVGVYLCVHWHVCTCACVNLGTCVSFFLFLSSKPVFLVYSDKTALNRAIVKRAPCVTMSTGHVTAQRWQVTQVWGVIKVRWGSHYKNFEQENALPFSRQTNTSV